MKWLNWISGKGAGLKRAAILAPFALLAGCQVIPKGVEDTGPVVQQPVEEEQPQITDALPTDGERHRIALLVPLTGSNAGIGQSIANATTMALLDTNATNIRITSYDTAQGARTAAQSAVNDGNALILGPLLSEDVASAVAVAQPARIPVISYTNDVSVANGNVFIMGHVPSQSVERVVNYARSEGITQFAGLIPTGEYGRRASETMLATVKAAGGNVVSMQTYDRSKASVEGAARRLKEIPGYDAVLIADSGRMAVLAAPILKSDPTALPQIMGTELWNTDSELSRTATIRGAWFASVPDGRYQQFASNYRARFGSNPYRLATLGYDSVLLTIRVARDWKPGTRFPVDQLLDKGGFLGIDGVFRFGRNGIAERALEVQQVTAGAPTIVSPAPQRFEN